MASYQYQIFVPGGNKTALVVGLGELARDEAQRKIIQDAILEKHKNDTDGEVEQVGFISTAKSASPQLMMTGGEFCANAVRCAAAYYHGPLRLGGDKGGPDVEIKVSGSKKPIKAGLITTRSSKGVRLKAWAYMPVPEDSSKVVVPLKDGMYYVTVGGIPHLIVPQTQAAPYIRDIFSNYADKKAQTKIALDFLEKKIKEEALPGGKTCHVVFLEHIADVLKIHPFIHVASTNTSTYESACGSSAASVGLLHCFLIGESVNFSLLQPSGSLIRVEADYAGDMYKNVRISGSIEFGDTFTLEI
ncbi:MAG: hypothetical protein FWC96_04550 [Oscillospiraceae bacterium]|nr:hypothetical protein [Oscillospiraceae bacterium]